LTPIYAYFIKASLSKKGEKMDKKFIFIPSLIFVLFELLCSPSLVFCGENSFGIKVGMPLGFYTGKGYNSMLEIRGNKMTAKSTTGDIFTVNPDFGLGYCAGIFFNIGITNFLALRQEVYFTRAVVRYGWEETTYYYGGYFYESISYLQFPVLIVLGFSIDKAHRFNFFAGPDLFIKITDIESKSIENGITTYESQIDSVVRTFLLNVTAGLDYTYYFNNRYYFLFDLRYSLGITDMREGATYYENWKMHYITFQTGVGFVF
jgi:hypothetical protein